MNEFADWYDEACTQLNEAVQKGRHPYHLVVAACVNDADAPELRTVVLRGFDATCRRIMFHTDIRSPKARWMQRDPRVSLLFYDRETKVQLRFYAKATVHHQDALCERQWQGTRADSKLCYLSPHGSGEAVSNAEKCGMDGRRGPVTNAEDDRQAFAHFAVISCAYDLLDMLRLNVRGHERALLSWDDANRLHGQWQAV